MGLFFGSKNGCDKNAATGRQSGPGEIIGKAILLGCPVVLLADGGCMGANWLSDMLLTYVLFPAFGFDGHVVTYEGSYWVALWDWLFGDSEEE